MFCRGPGTLVMPRVHMKTRASTTSMTSQVVKMGAEMLGWLNTMAFGPTGSFGAKSHTTCGAGSSRFALMRSAMPLIRWPGSPLGNGGMRKKARTSRTMTAITSHTMLIRGRPLSPPVPVSPAAGGGAASVGPVAAPRSLDTLRSTHMSAAVPPRSPRSVRRRLDSIEPGEEPHDQLVHGPGPHRGAEQEARDGEDREGPKLVVDPVAPEGANQGGNQEDDPDLGEEGEIRSRLTGLDHGLPDKAAGV